MTFLFSRLACKLRDLGRTSKRVGGCALLVCAPGLLALPLICLVVCVNCNIRMTVCICVVVRLLVSLVHLPCLGCAVKLDVISCVGAIVMPTLLLYMVITIIN